MRGETSAPMRVSRWALGTAHQRKNRPRSMVGNAHPTKIALLQLVQDVRKFRLKASDRKITFTEL